MGKTRTTLKDTLLSAAILAIANMGDALLYLYLPANYLQIGISSFWVGVILSINRFTRLFFNGRVAWFLSRKGIKMGIALAAVLASFTTFSYGLIDAVSIWILLRVLWGISFSALRLGNTLYALEHPQKGTALGWSRAVMEIGPVVALLAGPFLLLHSGRSFTFLLLGLFGIAAAFLALFLTNIKTDRPSKKELRLSFPDSFNILVLINAFITEGVLVVLLISLVQDEQLFSIDNLAVLVGILLVYRRLSLVLFSPLSGRLADKWGFEEVFLYTVILSSLGLLFILLQAPTAGIIMVFTFSAMNACVATGGAIVSGRSFIKEVSDNATWRDIGTATGAFAGSFFLPVTDLRWLILGLFFLYAAGIFNHINDRKKSAERFASFQANVGHTSEQKNKEMKTETIEILQKTRIGKEVKKNAAASGCCGGEAVSNEDACCKLDEDKKAGGESGCGCNTVATVSTGSACCG